MIIKRFSNTKEEIPEVIRDAAYKGLDNVGNILEIVDDKVAVKPARKKIKLIKDALSTVKGVLKKNPKHNNKHKKD